MPKPNLEKDIKGIKMSKTTKLKVNNVKKATSPGGSSKIIDFEVGLDDNNNDEKLLELKLKNEFKFNDDDDVDGIDTNTENEILLKYGLVSPSSSSSSPNPTTSTSKKSKTKTLNLDNNKIPNNNPNILFKDMIQFATFDSDDSEEEDIIMEEEKVENNFNNNNVLELIETPILLLNILKKHQYLNLLIDIIHYHLKSYQSIQTVLSSSIETIA